MGMEAAAIRSSLAIFLSPENVATDVWGEMDRHSGGCNGARASGGMRLVAAALGPSGPASSHLDRLELHAHSTENAATRQCRGGTKSNYHRFRASTGAILNWWPTTKALNFQGKEAEHFKDLFLRHTLVEVEQPEPSLSCDESLWIDLPDPSSPLGARGSVPDEKHRKVLRSF
jgi:hypothetical protein